jgi:pyruvate-ferredoxin/flavodoxin oxidoreductase
VTSFARTSLRTITRVFHRERTPDADEPGIPAVLDGLSAIAGIEARVCDGAALGASFPASIAARAWSSMRSSQNARNAFDRPMSEINADDARGALSSAIGLALSGERAVTFLAGGDAIVSTDLFTHAAGQGLPLVVHLSTGAATAHAQTLGSGHETYHSLADTGCALLLAANVQEAADATLIARRAAEASLIPFIVAMDAEPTALAAQDVRAPSDALLREFLASPADLIEPTSDAQRMAFGPNRRRVPRRHDLERPNLLAPLQGPESFAIGAASRSTYFANDADRAMNEAAAALATRTGRTWEPVLEHRVSDARTVMVVQGGAIETAIAVADFVRKTSGRKIGVIGIRCLRPLPVARIAQALKGKRTVAVLERLSPTHGGDGPLMREILSVLARSHEAPTVVNAFYGHAGFPLRACDLLEFADKLESPQRDRCFIGMSFTEDSSQLPKRQALTDALRRNFPEADAAGVRRHGSFTRLSAAMSEHALHSPGIAWTNPVSTLSPTPLRACRNRATNRRLTWSSARSTRCTPSPNCTTRSPTMEHSCSSATAWMLMSLRKTGHGIGFPPTTQLTATRSIHG